ncbi:MAG: ABC transporter ATP-binding protein [Firmicutes bacterium]|nr:ABC transporter ATP-binding protein [Bacillota bacterium]
MNNDYILQCRDLSKSFGGRWALAGINIDIAPGRIVGLLGPNGSGKTTFIKIANGLIVPNMGSIKIAGSEPGPLTKNIVSYLPDVDYLPNYMNVQQLVSMFDDFYKDFNKEKAFGMLKNLDIEPNLMLKTLSKGTKEKVQLILAMSREARLYMLDEPIGGVDPAARDYILNTIINNYSENASVIISTHLISDIEQILDDVIFIRDGRILLCQSVDDIRAKEGKSVDEYFREVFSYVR